MYRALLFLATYFAIYIPAMSQEIPQGFTYQASLQNEAGLPVSNANVPVRIGILSGGNTVWQETHNVTTNEHGIFSLIIGKGIKTGGTVSGFKDIDWTAAVYSVKTEVNLGNGYSDMGVAQLFSVPYALVSQKALEVANPPSVSLDQLTDVDVSGLQSGDVLQWSGTKWRPFRTETIKTDNELAGSGTLADPLKLSSQSASIGQVLKWDGAKWSPSLDQTSTGNQSVNVSSTLTGDGTSAAPLGLAAQGATTGQVLKWDGTKWSPSLDQTSTGNQSVNVSSTLTGDGTTAAPLGLAAQGATTGQVLKWDGTKWSPAIDNSTPTQQLDLNQDTDNNDPSAIKVTKSGTQGGPIAVTISSKSGNDNTGLHVMSDNSAISYLPVYQTAAVVEAKGKGGTEGNIGLSAAANAQQGTNIAVVARVENANPNYTQLGIESSVETTLNNGYIGKGVLSQSKISGGGMSVGVHAIAEGTDANRGVWSYAISDDQSYANQYGVWTEAIGQGIGFHYGIKSRAAGLGYNVGIHAIAEWGTHNYAGIFDGDVEINGKLKLQGKPFDLGTPTVGQVLKWDGTKWYPSLDETSTTVHVSTTLTGDGTSASPLGLAAQGATNGQVLKWDGTKWSPGNLTNLNISQNTDNNDPPAMQITKSGTSDGPTAFKIVSKTGGFNTSMMVTSDNSLSTTPVPFWHTAATISSIGKGGSVGNAALWTRASSQEGSNVALVAEVENAGANFDHNAIDASVVNTLSNGFTGTGINSNSRIVGGGNAIGVAASAEGTGINKGVHATAISEAGSTSNQYGIYSEAIGSGTGTHSGIYVKAKGSGVNYGIEGIVDAGNTNGTTAQRGLYGYVLNAKNSVQGALGHTTGVFGGVSGNSVTQEGGYFQSWNESPTGWSMGLGVAAFGKGNTIAIDAMAIASDGFNSEGSMTGISSSVQPGSNTPDAHGLRCSIYNASATTNLYGGFFTVSRKTPAVNGANSYSIWASNTAVEPGNYAGYFSGRVQVEGDLIVWGTFTNPSDAKLKENIRPMSSALDKLMLLKPSQYRFKKQNNLEGLTLKEGEQFGLIAQEVEDVFPELVKTASYVKLKEEKITQPGIKEGESREVTSIVPSNEREEVKTLDYTSLIPILIKGLQEQQELIKNQQQQIEELKKEIGQLKK